MNINIEKIVAFSLQDGFVIVDDNWKVLYWNTAATDILGYKSEEVLGTDFYKLIIPPQYIEKYGALFSYFNESIEKKYRLELPVLTKEKTEVWLDFSISTALIEGIKCRICYFSESDKQYQISSFINGGNHQTHFKLIKSEADPISSADQYNVYPQPEQALLSNPDWERFFLITMDLLCFVDRQGVFIKLNRTFELTLGYANAEMQHQPFLEFVHPEDVTMTKKAFDKVLAGQVCTGFCNRYRCKSGDYRWFEWTVLIDETNNMVYGIARNVTDRKKAETQLQKESHEVNLARNRAEESWQYLKNVMQNLDAIIWQLDESGVFTLYEGRLLRKLGRKSGHNVGKSIYKLYKEYPQILKTLQHSLEGHSIQVETEYYSCILNIICTPLLDSRGEVCGAVGVVIDKTLQHNWEKRLALIKENYLRSADFNDILTSGQPVEKQNQRLSNYGIDCGKPIIGYLISITRNKPGEDNKNSKEDVMEWLVKNGYIWSWYNTHGFGVLVQNDSAVTENKILQKSKAQKLISEMHRQFPEFNIRIGVVCSNPQKGIFNFSQLYNRMYTALLLSMGEKKPSNVFHYNDSGIYRILPVVIEHMEVDEFVHQVLGGIIQYEKEKGGNLLSTLNAILNSPNLKTVALNLRIHHNTVLWRKNKIEDILGHTLDDANTRMHLAMAIKLHKIREVMQKEF